MKLPPGPRGSAAYEFLGGGSVARTLTFLENTARTYGPISSWRILTQRIYLVDEPELIQEILVTKQHSFQRDTGANLLRELVGNGLLTSEEPRHRERRRMLQPAFHRAQIASYADIMIRETERVAQDWQSVQSSAGSLDINTEMKRLTLAIVGSTLFGTDFRDSAGQIAKVLQRVTQRSRWIAPAFAFIEPIAKLYRRVSPYGRSLFFESERKELESIVAPILQQRRESQTHDVLSLLLEQRDDADAKLSDEDVLNEVVTFVLAGHETTATALTWTWYLLSRHPEVEQKLHAELDSLIGDRAVTLEDVSRLRYTSMVFTEAMRLYPPALAFGRRPKEPVTLGGYSIPRGASVFLSPYITQRNERFFPRPTSFEPERWENISIPKFAYFPFGGGAKMCIGEPFAKMEGVLALAILARRWRLIGDDTLVGLNPGITLQPDRPILMQPTMRVATTALQSQ